MTAQRVKITRDVQITNRELASKYKQAVANGGIPSMHWFRIAEKWRHLSFSYNNPYNIISVHSEMFLLSGLAEEVTPYLRNRSLVFLGVGVGDTEMLLIEQILRGSPKLEIVAVDVNPEFLEDFGHSLRNKSLENDKYSIRLHSIQAIFEEIEESSLVLGVPGKRAFICLGHTIGNYIDTVDFIRVLQRLASPDDVVVLGYQLDTYARELFAKYKSNEIFSDFVLSYAPRKDKRKLRWVFDDKKGTVTAKYQDTRVFFSRKFALGTVKRLMQAAGFEALVHTADTAMNACILVGRCAGKEGD